MQSTEMETNMSKDVVESLDTLPSLKSKYEHQLNQTFH